MPTPSGHTRAIPASTVKSTAVYNSGGDRIGHVEDVVLDKLSNNVMFAVLGFGGFLGIGEKFHPLPWSLLDYDKDKKGYVVNLSKEVLEKAPVYNMDELIKNDGDARTASFSYYEVDPYW